MFGINKTKRRLGAAEERIDALEQQLKSVIDQVEAVEDYLAENGDDLAGRESVARLAEQAFTDGVANILGYSAGLKGSGE